MRSHKNVCLWFDIVASPAKQSFCFLKNVMDRGIRGQCPSVASNKEENDTSVYIFPLLAMIFFMPFSL